jgi:peptidoglycan LD-endopeptidase LytH
VTSVCAARRWNHAARGIAVITAVAALGSGLGAGSAGAQSLDDLKNRVAAAQRAADDATRRYEEARTRYEELGNQITALQDQIRVGKEEAAELRRLARKRAVEAYTGQAPADDSFLVTDGDPLDAVRREKLLEQTKRREDDAAERLSELTDQLDRQRRDVEAQRAAQAEALDALEAESGALQDELRAAQQAQARLEEELRKQQEAQAAAEEARRIAREASGRSNADYGGSFVSTGIVCPIRGPVSFIDSWGFPRAQGSHQGVDLMSPLGTPNVAVVSGNVEFKSGGTSGLGARLYGDDGTLYYYFHLSAYEGGPRHVGQGEVIGYVGNTGDASGGAPHTHFEVHPGGGAAVNPYPSVAAVC